MEAHSNEAAATTINDASQAEQLALHGSMQGTINAIELSGTEVIAKMNEPSGATSLNSDSPA